MNHPIVLHEEELAFLIGQTTSNKMIDVSLNSKGSILDASAGNAWAFEAILERRARVENARILKEALVPPEEKEHEEKVSTRPRL